MRGEEGREVGRGVGGVGWAGCGWGVENRMTSLARVCVSLLAIYREALVLCDLEGVSRRDAALRISVPEGTLSARLSRARRLLAAKLARHGHTFPAGLLAAMLSESASIASFPRGLVLATV